MFCAQIAFHWHKVESTENAYDGIKYSGVVWSVDAKDESLEIKLTVPCSE